MRIFEELESEVRSYCRSFPALFTKAKGHRVFSEDGREFIDFFTGAGALNYGHNPDAMKAKLIEYIADDGITHSLDLATKAKAAFLRRFHDVILKPRKLDYKVMFPGPTGTNSVECALKLARKVTGRDSVISFTNAFHGMTLGSLSVTGNSLKREGAGLPLQSSVHMPYEGYFGDDVNTLDYLERFLNDGGSGVSLPAAIILETVQGEGGLNTASFEWLKQVEEICRRWDVLLIVDDIQVGCGRTGPFFSFERAGISPDIVCLSKALSGYGLPMSLTIFKPELDVWSPGEHNGTFRGHNLAFVTATEALSHWERDELTRAVDRKAERIRTFLHQVVSENPGLQAEVRGRGLLQGIACEKDGLAEKICAAAFQRGLLMETSGPKSEVVKLLPPLVIDDDALEKGLSIVRESVAACIGKRKAA